MSENPLVSVIVPVYNVEEYLNECIESIVNQTYTELNIILVNDGSEDNSLQICRKWEKKDRRIIVIDQKNQGVSKARNAGLKRAMGNYVIFVDADDFIDLTAIEFLVKNREQHILPGLAIDRFLEKNEKGSKPQKVTENFRDLMDRRSGYFCWGILYDIEIIKKYHIVFPERIENLEDVIWNIIYGIHVENTILIEKAQYHYRNREGSITSKCKDYEWQIECWIKVLNVLDSVEINKEKKKYLKQEKRRCRNNLFAEVYCGNVSWKNFAHICEKNQSQQNFKIVEFYIYKVLFGIKNISFEVEDR